MAKKKKFYRKAKPKEGSKKLPRNYRNITEKIQSDHTVFITGVICILAAMIVIGIDLYSNYTMKKQLEVEKVKVAKELEFWQREVKDRPSYRDGYFSLALIYYQLKDFKTSSEYLEKALSLDPNFETGKQLRGYLEEN